MIGREGFRLDGMGLDGYIDVAARFVICGGWWISWVVVFALFLLSCSVRFTRFRILDFLECIYRPRIYYVFM